MARTAVNRVRPFSILSAQDPQSMPSTRRRNDWLASSVMIAPRPVVPATAYGRCSNYRVKAMNLTRSEEHTSELQSLMRISYAVFCLKKKKAQPVYNLMHSKKQIVHKSNTT